MKPQPPLENKLLEKPIILFGSGRSGTTIISEILFQHEQLAWHSNYQELFPRWTFVNYIRHVFDNKWWKASSYWKFIGFSKNTRQKGKALLSLFIFNPIERYKFWDTLFGKRINFSRGFLLNETATPEEKKQIRSFLAKQVYYQGKQRLIMKFTGPSRLEYLHSIFPDAYFIEISRQPIPTIRSWLEVGFWKTKGINRLWWTGAYTPEEEAFAETIKHDPALITTFQYKKILETTAYEIEKLNLNVIKVTYEEFIKQPVETIQQLMKTIELPASESVNQYLQNIVIANRNNRIAKKVSLPEETQQKILEMLSSSTKK